MMGLPKHKFTENRDINRFADRMFLDFGGRFDDRETEADGFPLKDMVWDHCGFPLDQLYKTYGRELADLTCDEICTTGLQNPEVRAGKIPAESRKTPCKWKEDFHENPEKVPRVFIVEQKDGNWALEEGYSRTTGAFLAGRKSIQAYCGFLPKGDE